MSLTQKLTEALAGGINQIGQLRILTDHELAPIVVVHLDDADGDLSSLQSYSDPDQAREIGLYAPDGGYRFTKGEMSLSRGWILLLQSAEELRRALDLFYPASLGLWTAWKEGNVRIQNLRDKLGRQTGMYRHSATVSDAGAQELVQSVCGPANRCVKKILWQLDAATPLEESEASRFNGIVNGATEKTAIPMVCQEACNHFVAQARQKSKEEFEAKP
ncbi:DR2241 family protein [Akkermansiaceae bacterium]|nr:DR2241 family protein [Akkermansiaceae bacterium]MDB4537444.1 DR2241 family protein [Akkermansiaceae bacterium]